MLSLGKEGGENSTAKTSYVAMLGMLAHTYNPGTQKPKANYEFEARLGYTGRSWKETKRLRAVGGQITHDSTIKAFNLSNLKKQEIERWSPEI